MKTILVIDNEETINSLYTNELSNAGYRVFNARSASEALSALDKHQVDLAILEIQGIKNGFDILEKMILKKRNLKVIINSISLDYSHNFNSWLADAYLLKSSDTGELEMTINKLLNRKN